MPSVSAKQHKLMQIAAHTKGGYGGVPQSVGRDFAAADKKAGKHQRKAHKTILGGHKRPRVTQTPFGGDDLAGM